MTHSQAIVEVPTAAQVERFLPPYNRGQLQLHPDNPITVAPQVNEDWLMEMRRQSDEAMKRSVGVIQKAYQEFKDEFGRGDPSPFIEEYMAEDADIILGGDGDVGPAREGCYSPAPRAGDQGGIRPGQVLPTLRNRGAAPGIGPQQGGVRHRPGLLIRVAILRRGAVQRIALGPVLFGTAAAYVKLHCWPWRA